MAAEDLPEKSAKIEVSALKVEVTKDDSWETAGMIIVIVLAIYFGIKVINKFFEENKDSLWK